MWLGSVLLLLLFGGASAFSSNSSNLSTQQDMRLGRGFRHGGGTENFIKPHSLRVGSNGEESKDDTSVSKTSRLEKVGQWIRTYVPPFLLAFTAVETLLTGYGLVRASEMKVESKTILKVVFTVIFEKNKARGIVQSDLHRLALVFARSLVLAGLLTRPAKHYLDWAVKQKLTKRMVFVATVAIMTTSLSNFLMVLAILQHVPPAIIWHAAK